MARTERLSMEAAAEYVGLPRGVLLGAAHRGELKGIKPGKSLRSRWFFERAELDRWVASLENAS
jgi:excisionase family DNA binding protein